MMRLPLPWLHEFVQLPHSAEELADRIIYSSSEVEAIEDWATRFAHIVVAEIEAIDAHPRSETLHLVSVAAGAHSRQVVCGAGM
jgi:predicted RNA-binding protein with EMAP domain